MSKTAKKIIRKEYNRLKNLLDKMIKPDKNKAIPQWVLQPVKKMYNRPVILRNQNN
jgi:hypothetical protein